MLTHGPLTVGIVGAGCVGRALGRGLRAAGWRIGPVITRGEATARHAVRAIGDGRPHAQLTRQLLAADVVLLCAPDAQLIGIAARLAEMGGKEWRGRIVLHTSGRLDSRELRALAECGAATGSLHAVRVISRRGATPLEGCFFELEGSAKALHVARRICRDLGGVPLRISTDGKGASHAARSFASPFLAASFEAGTRILMAQGFTRRRAMLVLAPLARRTLENVSRLGPRSAPDRTRDARDCEALMRFPRSYRDAYVALERLRDSLGELRAPRKLAGRGARHEFQSFAHEKKTLGGENS
jgi:predicted short-subunit dehydrogenase-like oxidoreductase (DUF2520 family)